MATPLPLSWTLNTLGLPLNAELKTQQNVILRKLITNLLQKMSCHLKLRLGLKVRNLVDFADVAGSEKWRGAQTRARRLEVRDSRLLLVTELFRGSLFTLGR